MDYDTGAIDQIVLALLSLTLQDVDVGGRESYEYQISVAPEPGRNAYSQRR